MRTRECILFGPPRTRTRPHMAGLPAPAHLSSPPQPSANECEGIPEAEVGVRHPRRGTFPLWCAHGGRKGSARRSPFDFSVCNTPVCQCRSMPAFRFARRAVFGTYWMELRRASTRPLPVPPLVAASTPRSESILPASLWVPCRTTRTVPASPVMSASYNTTAAVLRARTANLKGPQARQCARESAPTVG
jgi:hypothetical protein